jgi:drug/metabolite transporter (DMT)-like permease
VKKYDVGLFVAIVSVSFSAVLIVSTETAPLTIAFYRLLFTTALLSPFLLMQRYRREFQQLKRGQLYTMVGIGIILAGHFAFWVSSLEKTSVASSVILVTAHPALVTPLAAYMLKERYSRINVAGISLSMIGVFILVLGNYSLEAMTLEGNLLAVLGGVAAGLYILGGRSMRNAVSTPIYALTVYSVAASILLVLCLAFQRPLVSVSTRDIEIIFLMAVGPGILGHTLYNWSLGYVRAGVASVALLGEPLGSAFLAFVLPWINQVPSEFTITGGCLILLGIYWASRYNEGDL